MNVRTVSREFVNLLVDLDERFSDETTKGHVARLHAQDLVVSDCERPEERYLSWIDWAFGGTWSGEAANASAILVTQAHAPAGFAAYGASGLKYYWLRAWSNREDVGILGPAGLTRPYDNDATYKALLGVALGRMRKRGYRQALVPCVTEPLLDRFVSATGGRIVEKFSMNRIAPDIRTTVLASGGGTNFQAVIDALPDGLGLELSALVVNRSDAHAIERAKRAGIAVIEHVWDRGSMSRERYDEELVKKVARTEPDLILMLGWTHLVSPAFLERFPQAINIHPAFLPHDDRSDVVAMPDGTVIPAFRGARAIRDALAAGSTWYGATAHRVVLEVDRGEILKRAPLPLVEKEEEAALAALRPTEHSVLIGAIRRFIAER